MMTRATLQDLGFAFVVGLLVALSPFTTPRLLESLLGGLAAGGAVYAVRRITRSRSAESEADEELARVSLPPLSVWVAFGLFIALFYPTLRWLMIKATASVWTNGHGLFTPFIMGYLAVHRLRDYEGEPEEGSAWGFVFIAAGVALLLLDLIPRTFYVASFGLILCLPGLSLLFLGPGRTRALALPLALGLFMIPIPFTTSQHLFLQEATAILTVPVLRLIGYSVLRENTTLHMSDFSVEVVEACSGFSALYAGVFLAVILVAYSPTWTRKLIIVASIVPMTLASNVLRILLLILLADSQGVQILETFIHPASGAVSFWIAMVGIFAVAGRDTTRAVVA